MDNQQTETKAAAVAQRSSPEATPGAEGKGTPEKTYSKVEYDRAETGRRQLQVKFNKSEETIKDLQSKLAKATAKLKSYDEALSEKYDDESFRKRVKEFADRVAEHDEAVEKFNKDREEFDTMRLEQENITLEPIRKQYAEQYGVDVSILEGITDPEQIHFTAFKNRTKEPGKTAESEGSAEKSKTELPLMPGANTGLGPRTAFSHREIQAMDNKTYAEHHEAIVKALAEGKIFE